MTRANDQTRRGERASLPAITRVGIDSLTPDPENANLGTERGLALLDQSLRDLGAGRSILVDKNGVVIAGNKTLERAADVGITDVLLVPTDGRALVAVVRTDLDLANDPKAVRLALADNRISEIDLKWQPQTLLDIAQKYGREIAADLWDEPEWRDSVVGRLAGQAEPEGDPGALTGQAGELLKKWQVEPGQLWLIPSKSNPGFDHRLFCGDATQRESLEAACGQDLANLLVTSPPYWVGMEYETQKSEADIDSFIRSCAAAWVDFVYQDYGRMVINTGTAAIHRIEKGRKVEVLPLVDKWAGALRQRGWLARNFRIWGKVGKLPGVLDPASDVVDQHWEHLITFDHDSSEFDYLTTYYYPNASHRGQEKVSTPWAQQGVWTDIPGDASADGKHVAAFHIEIPRRFITLYTKPGERVLDPFMGSGTTLLACEVTQRLALGVELSPSYLAASLERFAEYGLEPHLAQAESVSNDG